MSCGAKELGGRGGKSRKWGLDWEDGKSWRGGREEKKG